MLGLGITLIRVTPETNNGNGGTNRILQEDGDFILQEDNDKILTEAG